MESIHETYRPSPLPGAMALSAPAREQSEPGLPLVLLLALSAGLAVASLYYTQPMLAVLSEDLHASTRAVGMLPMLTQLGYALGILLLSPLGDRLDRRRVIVAKALVLGVALLLAAAAPSIHVLLLASLAIGLSATLAQDIVPAAATLAPEAHRGRVVGTVMTGLLLGILLSRVISGFTAEHFGWRTMFLFAAAGIAAIAAAAWKALPRFKPTSHLSYGALLRSVGHLWKAHRDVRHAAIAQGLLSVGFSAFWSTLAVLLHAEPFHLGSTAAGAFGLAGAAGAFAAPLAGGLADRHGARIVTRVGAVLALVSFALLGFWPWLVPSARLVLLAITAIGFDLGFQVTLIAHQSIVYSVDPAARSRLNALLIVGMFIGMSVGAALGGLLLAQWGWLAVAALATSASGLALIIRFRA
ncbi:MFS transporter [Hyalangium minutum]|uniref:Permeases of the major facilitator protein n=1 Tax=Hyalangium minutum TaxID=394096 RepID=A0A085W2P3_9BACT|nr:MFS transporter [Hyalangium minutum]KFE61956.1 Permeases of the major facilitator protein [Hyalangium minutum]